MVERILRRTKEVIINFMDGSTQTVPLFNLQHKPEVVSLSQETIGRVLATPGEHLEVLHRGDDPLHKPEKVEVLNTLNIKSIIFPVEIRKS